MTTRLTGRRIERNTKHFKRAATTLVVLATVTVQPHLALAFEAQLSPTPDRTPDINPTEVLAGSLTIPTYRHLESGVIVAPTTPRTEASVAPIKSVVEPEPASAFEVLAGNGDVLVALEGEASFYSRAGCLGCSPSLTMANGQTLDDNALTMAIGADRKHLVGHSARVTNLATGLSVDVRITDTGGFYKARYGNRVADLTIATKNAIGMTGGVAQVRVEVF